MADPADARSPHTDPGLAPDGGPARSVPDYTTAIADETRHRLAGVSSSCGINTPMRHR